MHSYVSHADYTMVPACQAASTQAVAMTKKLSRKTFYTLQENSEKAETHLSDSQAESQRRSHGHLHGHGLLQTLRRKVILKFRLQHLLIFVDFDVGHGKLTHDARVYTVTFTITINF